MERRLLLSAHRRLNIDALGCRSYNEILLVQVAIGLNFNFLTEANHVVAIENVSLLIPLNREDVSCDGA